MQVKDFLDQPNKKNLYNDYIIDNLQLNELSKKYNCSVATIARALKELHIKKDKSKQVANLSKNKDLKYNIDINVFINYYNTHTIKDTILYFNIPEHYLYKLLEKNNIDNTTHINNINKIARLAGKTITEKHMAISKGYATKFKNNSFKKSKEENNFYKLLCNKFSIDDIEYPYINDSRYPFNCDFYIKSLDLFIEYNGHYTHGHKPYNGLTPGCSTEINYLKEHHVDLTTYLFRDPKKLNTALKNNIKLLIIYPRDNTYYINNGEIKDIGKFDVTKINELC